MTYHSSAHITSGRTLLPLAILAMAAALIGSGALTIAAHADPGGGVEQAAKYSECMRANGVADFPDANADGQTLYGGVSVTKPVWVQAVGACTALEPSAWSGDAGRTPEQQDAALKFAQCVRDNGVPDFPDPATARDPLIDTSQMRGGVSARSIPELKGAQQACRDLFEAALPPLGLAGLADDVDVDGAATLVAANATSAAVRSGARSEPEHIAGISKTTYVLTTPRSLH